MNLKNDNEADETQVDLPEPGGDEAISEVPVQEQEPTVEGEQPGEMPVAETSDAEHNSGESEEESAQTNPSSEPGADVALDDAISEEVAEDSDVDAEVEFEGDRPIVKELIYQAPKGKQTQEELEEAEALQFASVAEAKSVVEGFLFSCNEPLTVAKLSKLMNNLHPKTVRGLLLELQWDYENHPGALQIVEIAGGYQMSTRAFVAPWMFRMHKHKRRSALSPATLETLAIVAYRQPITKGEIETIRGVESGAPLRTLQDLNLIEASGRREVIGRPQLYVTTEQFLKTFGLKSVADLPSISELKNRFAEEQKIKRVVAEDPKPELKESAPEEETPTAENIDSGSTEEQGEGLSGEADSDNVLSDGEAFIEDELQTESAEDEVPDAADDDLGEELDTDLDDLDEDLDEEDSDPIDGKKRKASEAGGAFLDENSLDGV